jgi:hypothetical protein
LDASSALSVRPASDAAAAAAMVRDRKVYGAFVFAGSSTVTLLVANGGGHSADAALTAIATGLTQSSGATLQVHDLAPTSPNDPNGTVEFYCIVFLAIGAALGSTVLSRLLGTVRTFSHLARRLATLLGYSAALAFSITFLADIVYGALVGHFGLLFLSLWAYTFSIAVAAAGVNALFGTIAGVALTLTLTILGNTSAAGAVSRPLLNPFFRALTPYFPHGAGMSIVRGVQYFDGHGITEAIWCLAVWTACGLAFFITYTVRAERTKAGKHEGGADTNSPAEETASANAVHA